MKLFPSQRADWLSIEPPPADLTPIPQALPARMQWIDVDLLGCELVAAYLSTLESQKSRTTQEESFRRVATALGLPDWRVIPWHYLSFEDLQVIRGRLAEGWGMKGPGSIGLSTAKLTLSAIRALYRVAFLRGEVDQRTYELARMLTIKGSRLKHGRSLRTEEIARVLEAAERTPRPRGPLLVALLKTMLGTGMRREEPGKLTMQSDQGAHLVIRGKGNKERSAPLDDATRKALDDWMMERKRLAFHDRLFVFRGQTLAPTTVGKLLASLSTRAGVPFEPHDLRRTFATTLRARGLDIRDIQLLMGHSNIQTTIGYLHEEEGALADRRRAVRVIG